MRRDWEKHRSRDRMRRVGSEDAREPQSMMAPLLRGRPVRRRPLPLSKTELREMAARAMANTANLKITRIEPKTDGE